MRHGGARSGAGRKKGSGNKKRSADLIARLHLEGLTPLDVMLNTMKAFWKMAQNPDGTIDREKAQAAAMVAKDAAPYVHPRLNSIDNKISGEMNIGSIDAPVKEDREAWLAKRAALTVVGLRGRELEGGFRREESPPEHEGDAAERGKRGGREASPSAAIVD